MKESLTVSIINTREIEVLEACLDSLFEHPYTLGAFEVIVLNNASRPGSMDPIKVRFPQVQVIEQSRWRGFGANHNHVAQEATGDLLFLLNPDAVVHEGALDRLATALTGNSRAAVAAGPILNLDGSVWTSAPFPFPTPLRALGQALGVHRLPWRHSSPEVMDGICSDGWVSGSAFMIKASTYRAVSGFDERFFIYSEETDLMLRLITDGWRIAWVRDAYVTHAGRKSREPAIDEKTGATHQMKDYEIRRIVQYVRSKIAYMEKHHGELGALAYRLALGLDALIRLAMASVPPLRPLLEERGPHPAVTRQHHLTKLRAAALSDRGYSLADLADEWNQRIDAPPKENRQ